MSHGDERLLAMKLFWHICLKLDLILDYQVELHANQWLLTQDTAMYMKILLIDYLSTEGILTNYRVYPKNSGNHQLVLDRLADVHGPGHGEHDIDIGGVRIYNSNLVDIDRTCTQIRNFTFLNDNEEFSYKIEHMNLNVGNSNSGEGGMYYFIGPSGFRASRLFVSDPYDEDTDDDYNRKQFRHTVKWDTEFKSQMIEMQLRSGHGTFSFRTGGLFHPFDSGGDFIDCTEEESIINQIIDDQLLRDGGGAAIYNDLTDNFDWIEWKPSVFGFSINVNKLIKYFISKLRS